MYTKRNVTPYGEVNDNRYYTTLYMLRAGWNIYVFNTNSLQALLPYEQPIYVRQEIQNLKIL